MFKKTSLLVVFFPVIASIYLLLFEILFMVIIISSDEHFNFFIWMTFDNKTQIVYQILTMSRFGLRKERHIQTKRDLIR